MSDPKGDYVSDPPCEGRPHLWQALRSWPASWRCRVCCEVTVRRPCDCPRCCQEPPGGCQERPPFQAFTPDSAPTEPKQPLHEGEK